jgi:hypothetical protein
LAEDILRWVARRDGKVASPKGGTEISGVTIDRDEGTISSRLPFNGWRSNSWRASNSRRLGIWRSRPLGISRDNMLRRVDPSQAIYKRLLFTSVIFRNVRRRIEKAPCTIYARVERRLSAFNSLDRSLFAM